MIIWAGISIRSWWKSPKEDITWILVERIGALYGTPDEYEEKDNPNYLVHHKLNNCYIGVEKLASECGSYLMNDVLDEGYEAFILRMINAKKLKIEKVLDLK